MGEEKCVRFCKSPSICQLQFRLLINVWSFFIVANVSKRIKDEDKEEKKFIFLFLLSDCVRCSLFVVLSFFFVCDVSEIEKKIENLLRKCVNECEPFIPHGRIIGNNWNDMHTHKGKREMTNENEIYNFFYTHKNPDRW